MQETQAWFLDREDSLEKEMATHSSILAWRIPCTRGAWRATVHGVTKSWTLLNNQHTLSEKSSTLIQFETCLHSISQRILPLPQLEKKMFPISKGRPSHFWMVPKVNKYLKVKLASPKVSLESTLKYHRINWSLFQTIPSKYFKTTIMLPSKFLLFLPNSLTLVLPDAVKLPKCFWIHFFPAPNF